VLNAGSSLIENGGFEEPVVSAGAYVLFSTGSSFSGWAVTGAAGNVAPLSTSFTSYGYTWPAHTGNQTLDLTGISNTPTGVSQTVKTRAGTLYRLSFWSGNIVAPAAGAGSSSTVIVRIDGDQVLAATNSSGEGSTSLVWERFCVAFVAKSSSTVIELVNGDPSDDSSNIIDDVILE
jgi:hypothetical protein